MTHKGPNTHSCRLPFIPAMQTMEEVEGDYNSDSDEDLNEEEGCQENVVLLPGL